MFGKILALSLTLSPHNRSSFSEFSQRNAKEERYRAIEKVRERESLFNEFIVEVRRREKEDKQLRKEQVCFGLAWRYGCTHLRISISIYNAYVHIYIFIYVIYLDSYLYATYFYNVIDFC